MIGFSLRCSQKNRPKLSARSISGNWDFLLGARLVFYNVNILFPDGAT
jgi:hypothetical protein